MKKRKAKRLGQVIYSNNIRHHPRERVRERGERKRGRERERE